MHAPSRTHLARPARTLAHELRRPQVFLGFAIWGGLLALLLLMSVGV